MGNDAPVNKADISLCNYHLGWYHVPQWAVEGALGQAHGMASLE